jgi:N-acetylmuramoyl-L-alanine amidase CwlA
MKATPRFMTKNRCYTNAIKLKPTKLVLHSLGVAQPNANVLINSWNNQTEDKCVHAFIMEHEIIQTLPWNYKAWHVGKGPKGSWNSCAIGVEICEPSGHKYNGGTMVNYDVKKNATYFEAVYNNAVELFAYLCKEYSLEPLKDIYCHCEVNKLGYASNHADVMQWFPKHGKSMDTFRSDVKEKLAEMQKPKKNTVYRVQVGAFGIKDNAERLVKELKAKGYEPIIVEA